jgi:hypothetical protein
MPPMEGEAHIPTYLHNEYTMAGFKNFTYNRSLRLGTTGNAVHGKGLTYDLSFFSSTKSDCRTLNDQMKDTIHTKYAGILLFYVKYLTKRFS